jgi:hypothetical protein
MTRRNRLILIVEESSPPLKEDGILAYIRKDWEDEALHCWITSVLILLPLLSSLFMTNDYEK